MQIQMLKYLCRVSRKQKLPAHTSVHLSDASKRKSKAECTDERSVHRNRKRERETITTSIVTSTKQRTNEVETR